MKVLALMTRSKLLRVKFAKFGMWGDMVDVITCRIFGDCQLSDGVMARRQWTLQKADERRLEAFHVNC